ncbi:hypothetical protein N7478_013051 [Penicillium angulare]|uniref:uncharacterized protein n=1 Tax=Penicillium angulare TaxID=116970 RepID=UPI00254102AF|nr:uncharacterized protein N7478_013051 [Penicillium angulare]KAJ5256947.1 hypothetical protein N7478_013051 [Penicillium angulare]
MSDEAAITLFVARSSSMHGNTADGTRERLKEICPRRPQHLALDSGDSPPPAKKAKKSRGPKRTAPSVADTTSDGGLLLYNSVTPEIAMGLPSLDEASPVEDPFKGEIYCRWTGCANRKKPYAESSKLIVHYIEMLQLT